MNLQIITGQCQKQVVNLPDYGGGVHTRYVQRTHCCESPVSWMDLGRYSSEERPAPSGAGPDIICRRSAFLPWTCDGFRSSVHSGVTGPQQNYGPATQIPPTGDDAISDSSWNGNYIKKQPGFCIESTFSHNNPDLHLSRNENYHQ